MTNLNEVWLLLGYTLFYLFVGFMMGYITGKMKKDE